MTPKSTLLVGSIFILSLGCQEDPAPSTSAGGEGDGGEPEECATVVDGDVSVSGEDELATLEGVGRIKGELRISGEVESLGALTCLEEVGGRLTIERTKLRDLSGLEGLLAAESLVLSRNAELISTKGLGLERLVGEIDELSGFNSSRSLVTENHQLSELRFEFLREVGSMSIGICGGGDDGNGSLGEVGEAAFPALEAGVTLSVGSNPELRSVDGLVESFGQESPFMLVSFSDNSRLDGPMLQERWAQAGLEGRLWTCGNSGGEEACDCPPPP